MKNYLYHFEFFSGFYESYFYKQHIANNEKEAIIEIVSSFTEKDEDETTEMLNEKLGKDWTTKDFWKKMDMKFHSDDYYVAYTLLDIKEIDFDINAVGRSI